MQKEAFEDILDQEFERMPAYGDILGRLKIAILRDRLQNGNHYVEERLREIRDMVYKARTAADTIELIRIIDSLYNTIIDPNFEKDHGTLEQVMAVTLEELTEYDWEDFLTEELYEEALESYIEQMTNKITDMEDTAVTEEMEKQRQTKHKITILTEEELEKAYTYVELNFGKNLSDSCRREANELSDVQGTSQGLQPLFYRGNPEKSGKKKFISMNMQSV